MAHDPFIFLAHKGQTMLLMNDLEYGRSLKESSVDLILPLSEYKKRAEKKINKDSQDKDIELADILRELFQEYDIQRIQVPASFPLFLAEKLRIMGIALEPVKEPFFKSRNRKTSLEIELIRKAQRQNEEGMQHLFDILQEAEIRNEFIIYRGEKVTSEFLKLEYEKKLLEKDFRSEGAIVASGQDTVEPHNTGSGPLFAHQPIILDLFPQHRKNRFCGDLTRTVVKGRASAEIQKIWQTVYDAQMQAIDKVAPGVDASSIHKWIQSYFEEKGFPTRFVDGKFTGFIHGTGHGIGLDLHEAPRLSQASEILEQGNVITIEPGLYYPGVGGVRIEDIVAVTDTGVMNLTNIKKFLEIP
jgi:Xaa-Pro aminopeptidase